MNTIGMMNRTRTSPIPVQRTTRALAARVLTSLNAGKMVPLMSIPLLREDSIPSASYRVAFEMQETVEVLMNSINVRVMAYLVPKLAFDRFHGMDDINRSYENAKTPDGRDPPPWFEKIVAGTPGTNPILAAMGKHYRSGQQLNNDYIEAYNQIWNFRARNRSPDITLRTRLDTSLAPAFWMHQTFAHIVPDFDQAIIDGEVALSVSSSPKIPVTGISVAGSSSPNLTNMNDSMTGPGTTYPHGYGTSSGQGSDAFYLRAATADGKPDVYAVFDELAAQGITISLSNIEMARKTQAFANLRRQYNGHSEEFVIDLLMDGLSVPDLAWKQPMLLADQSTVFGMSKRYATDADNLTESVVNGMTSVDIRFSVPRTPCGGVVMIVAEIAPEQLFERQRDPYLHVASVDKLPQFLRDTLDPEKVVVVQNEEIDIDHDTPTDTFGYAPLNWEWAKSMPQIGGRFLRPTVDAAFDEDRQRIWAVETQNPVLSSDFYLVSAMHYKPFVVTADTFDHFDCLIRGNAVIRGNTVFGGLLVEATNDYEKVMEEAPTDRIQKPAPASTETPEQQPSLPGIEQHPVRSGKK